MFDDDVLSQMIEAHWDDFDATKSGILDKIETLSSIISFYLHEVNFNNQTVQ